MYIISNNEFDLAYQIMEDSFPKSEIRTYLELKKYFNEKKIIIYGIRYEKILTGVIMCWECDSCIFLENFAVNKAIRGKGLGSLLLKDIQKRYHNKLLVLEVEDPFDEISQRRIGFYERNGFILSSYGYMQPQINEEVNNQPLLLMTYPKPLTDEMFSIIKDDLFKNVYMLNK